MPKKQIDAKEIYNTKVQTMGTCKIPSTIQGPFTTDESIALPLGKDVLGNEFEGHSLLDFELAGPREKIYFDPNKTKCAIVTCGGLCPGLNDVIRSIVMACHHTYGVASVIGIRYGLEGFIPKYKHDVIELTPQYVSEIHNFGGTILGTSRGPQDPEEIVDTLERMNINILFMIGGDGSMKAAKKIIEEVEIRKHKLVVIGIPKTIDNDINFVTQSFGFETAVDAATQSLECAHTEARGAHNGIGLVKLMGRESGFIAAQAALSYAVVNYLLVPEAPFKLHGKGGLLEDLEERLKRSGHAVIVAAEGAGQHLIEGTGQFDLSGNPMLSDIATYLSSEIKKYFKEKNFSHTLKLIDPSYIVRSVPANSGDRVYCGFLGRYAVDAAMAGKTSVIIAKLMDKFVHIPIDIVTMRRRTLDTSSPYWKSVLRATGQSNLGCDE